LGIDVDVVQFADMLSQSLNLLVLPLPSRHDDNCSIGTIGGGRMPDAIAPHACSFNSSADYELALILKEIRFITDQVSIWGEICVLWRFFVRVQIMKKSCKLPSYRKDGLREFRLIASYNIVHL
jgi:hypothetical protein